jgi:hypothetical protein
MVSLISSDPDSFEKIMDDLYKFHSQEEQSDKIARSILKDLSNLQDENEDHNFDEENIFRYQVGDKGSAYADMISSKNIVHKYCQQLCHDLFFNPRPIYSFRVISYNPNIYICSLLLPQSVPAEARCSVSPPCEKRSVAKSLASLDAVRKLHLAGELDDHLRILDSSHSNNLENLKKFEIQVAVKTKQTPDMLLYDSNFNSDKMPYYFYIIDMSNSELSGLSTTINNDIKAGYEAISSAFFVFPFQLNADLLSTSFLLHFTCSIELISKLKFIKEKKLSRRDFLMLQVFHMSAFEAVDMLEEEELLNIDDLNLIESSCIKYVSRVGKVNSYNYLLCPAPQKSAILDFSIIDDENNFSAFLRKCSLDAQILAHNIKFVKMRSLGS